MSLRGVVDILQGQHVWVPFLVFYLRLLAKYGGSESVVLVGFSPCTYPLATQDSVAGCV